MQELTRPQKPRQKQPLMLPPLKLLRLLLRLTQPKLRQMPRLLLAILQTLSSNSKRLILSQLRQQPISLPPVLRLPPVTWPNKMLTKLQLTR